MSTSPGNGAALAATIPVENPAPGELLTTVPVLAAEEVASMAARARGARPPWAALGFEGRARILRRAQRWMLDNADRVLDCVVSETGKATMLLRRAFSVLYGRGKRD